MGAAVSVVFLLLGQGGGGKTFIVQQFVARVVAYAFGTNEAIRMLAFSNPQVTNFLPIVFRQSQSTAHAAWLSKR